MSLLRRQPWLLLLPLLAQAAPLQASSAQAAQAALAAGDFARAASAYQLLIDAEGPSASRLYQLGSAHFALGQFGPAVLAFERAALLAPRAADIQANLQQARQSAAPSAVPETGLTLAAALRWLSLNEWSWLAAAGCAGLAVLSLAWGLRGFPSPRAARAARLTLALSLSSAVLASGALWQRRGEAHWGIVLDPDPVLRLSPFAEAAPAGPLHTGGRIILGPRVQGWTRVALPESPSAGWLPNTAFAPLIPPATTP